MLLIAEIILTIFVWNKGWRWKSLIPMGSVIGIGVLIGTMAAAAGTSTIPVGVVIFDIIAVVVLIIMLCNPPKKEKITNTDLEDEDVIDLTDTQK